MGLSGEMLILSMLEEVEYCIEDKAPHDYQETLPLDLSLQGGGSSNHGNDWSSHQ